MKKGSWVMLAIVLTISTCLLGFVVGALYPTIADDIAFQRKAANWCYGPAMGQLDGRK